MIARSAETWVITRANNREAIERALPDLPERDSLRFLYVDLPAWARFWKRGCRGLRLYYFLWQIGALREARRCHRQEPFDLVWHLTLANAWLGSLASCLPGPFVYGPVGGGVSMPWHLVSVLGTKGLVYEVVRGCARFLARFANPLARLSWRRADVILAQNVETLAWFPPRARAKVRILQNAVAEIAPGMTHAHAETPTALFVSRLIPWKGGELALRAVERAPGWRLIICGGGEDERRLQKLARTLDLLDRVEFRGRLPQSDVGALMATADVLLHPSLHDDSPLAVTEALAHGLPIVCLDRGGPPLLGAAAALTVRASQSPYRIVEGLAERLGSVRDPKFGALARARAGELSFDVQAGRVGDILASFDTHRIVGAFGCAPSPVREPA
jgi:glycosyltransferase involved in cell wall biosynthesis